MKSKKWSILTLVALLALLALNLPSAAQAATPNPSIEVMVVRVGESIVLRGHDIPGGKLLSVRMDKYQEDKLGAGGILVTVTNSGAGGTFDESYKIPAALKSEEKIAVRFESDDGFFLYTSFINKVSASSTPTPVPTLSGQGGNSSNPQITPVSGQDGGKPKINVIAVEKNKAITVRAANMPAGIEFVIRVGPYDTFFTDYVITGKVKSGAGGGFDFNVLLPAVVKDVELVTVRLDGGGLAVFNAFKNVTTGSVPVLTPVPTLASSAIPGACSILSTLPSASVKPGADLDVIWKVKNTSGQTWESAAVDYIFVSGAALHKKTSYDLTQTVKNGETVNIVVDMRAPSTTGVYSENWAVVQGGKRYCDLPVTVTVK